MHPTQQLFESAVTLPLIPVCDHYAGSEKLMLKSLDLQQQLNGVFDITFDCEDGAAAGNELAHAQLVSKLINSSSNVFRRVGVRIHDISHANWKTDIDWILGGAANQLAYVTLPKVSGVAQTQRMIDYINEVVSKTGLARLVPIHVLIENYTALYEARQIAALPQVECLSFGIMDFVSAHYGAVPSSAMQSPGQFTHPLIQRAKLEISAACHAYGKIASHNVTTEIRDLSVVANDAERARTEFGYTRMWSIHPEQIRPIVAAFSPTPADMADAEAILLAASDKNWGPICHDGKLHDRASYRYYWQVLQRAKQMGLTLSEPVLQRFFSIESCKEHDESTSNSA